MILLIKNLVFTALVPATAAIYLPYYIGSRQGQAGGPLTPLALVCFAVGAALYGWCQWDFATFGRATPAPIDAPKRLVVRGLYRYVRNPMYLGILAWILGWAILFRSGTLVAYGLVVAATLHGFAVFHEEPHLARKFGAEYETYRDRVGRWLPRLARPSRPE